MFDFFEMLGNYEQRKVANYKEGKLRVDTCSVNDGRKEFETGVAHPRYNGGNWIIVACYDTREEAQAGHNEWVAKMTRPILPESLTDIANSESQSMIGEETFERQPDPLMN